MRKEIDDGMIAEAIHVVMEALDKRLQEKGAGSFMSSHEILGVLAEEYDEIVQAVRGNNLEELHKELEDMAVGVIFAIACIRNGGLQW